MDSLSLTPQEVADILKISKNTVYELIKRGKLNGYKVGNKVRVDMKDIEDYKNKERSNSTYQNNRSLQINSQTQNGNYKPEIRTNEFIISGQDILLDILSSYFEHQTGIKLLRSYTGSYNALYGLYMGNITIATSHLWDSETGQYNFPYIKKLLPGTPAIIVHLAIRKQGFYLQNGNPKNIKGWEDLKRSDISIINREKGSGTRILLDEYLKLLEIDVDTLNGYHNEGLSHLAVASMVANGKVDLGLGNEKAALQVKDIEFLPLQSERYDMIIKKSDVKNFPFEELIKIINSEAFKSEITGLGGYDLSDIGKITYI